MTETESILTLDRRGFISLAAAFAALPTFTLLGKEGTFANTLPWELADGTASDTTFVRRLYIDLCGRIPTKEEVLAFTGDPSPNKKMNLIEKLVDDKAFVDYWTLYFADLLRVKSEFPINLWPNAVYVYTRRIRAFVEEGEGWDEFARSLLTKGGSNFHEAESNFFRAVSQRTPEGRATAVSRTFLGKELNELPNAERKLLIESFENIRIKNTREWKEEIVYVEGPDRRAEYADHLIEGPLKKDFAATFARRITERVFGPDDAIGAASLTADDVIAANFKLEPLLFKVFASEAYSRGPLNGGFPIKRLDAEVLEDALCSILNLKRSYKSIAPEPFTYLPPERPTICIEDGSITSSFLLLFGRPARDFGLLSERNNEVTAAQRLHLFNSRRLSGAIAKLNKSVKGTRTTEIINGMYLTILSRTPMKTEDEIIRKYRETKGNKYPFARDFIWSLINTREFLYRF